MDRLAANAVDRLLIRAQMACRVSDKSLGGLIKPLGSNSAMVVQADMEGWPDTSLGHLQHAVNAYAHKERLARSNNCLEQLVKAGSEPDSATYSALMNTHAQWGDQAAPRKASCRLKAP